MALYEQEPSMAPFSHITGAQVVQVVCDKRTNL